MTLNLLKITFLLATVVLSSTISKRSTPCFNVAPTEVMQRSIPVAPREVVEELKIMQKFTAAASCKNGLETWTCNTQCTGTPGTIFTSLFRSENTNGYIAFNPSLNAIIVTFPGSRERGDWLGNFQFDQVAMENSTDASIRVHRGFQTQYMKAKSTIRSIVGDLLITYPTAHIRVTGHSLGGALAVFCAVDLANAFPAYQATIKLYSFGQPRCGNDKFAGLLDSLFGPRFFRIVYQKDVVPAVPSRTSKMGYLHGGVEHWIDYRNDTIVCDGDEDIRCSLSVHNFDKLNTILELTTLLFRPALYPSWHDHGVYYPGFKDEC